MSYKSLLVALVLLSFAQPAFANWWIVRSADEKCLVVDIEPSSKDVTKVGKEVYQTREQAEADVKGLCRNQTPLLLLPLHETPSEPTHDLSSILRRRPSEIQQRDPNT